MTTKTYVKAAERRQQILKIALDIAEKTHYRDLTRDGLVEPCNTAAGNINRIMGDMNNLRELVIEYAIQTCRVKVVAQAIIDNHPCVSHLTTDERLTYIKESVAA